MNFAWLVDTFGLTGHLERGISVPRLPWLP
jgi:hypothetical protein